MKWTRSEIRRHFHKTSKKNQVLDTDEKVYTKVFSGVQNNTQSETKFRPFTSRTDICEINSVTFRQAVAKTNEKKNVKTYTLRRYFTNHEFSLEIIEVEKAFGKTELPLKEIAE